MAAPGQSTPMLATGLTSQLAPTATHDPRGALRSLIHTRLVITLKDGRELTGYLLAIDRSGSLLLSSTNERRVLPHTEWGDNVARHYPSSRDSISLTGMNTKADPEEQEEISSGHVRLRELASVLVPCEHVARVAVSTAEARAWARSPTVAISDGKASFVAEAPA